MNDYEFVIDFFKKVGCVFVIFIILNIPNFFISYNFITNIIIGIISCLLGWFIGNHLNFNKDENMD